MLTWATAARHSRLHTFYCRHSIEMAWELGNVNKKQYSKFINYENKLCLYFVLGGSFNWNWFRNFVIVYLPRQHIQLCQKLSGCIWMATGFVLALNSFPKNTWVIFVIWHKLDWRRKHFTMWLFFYIFWIK